MIRGPQNAHSGAATQAMVNSRLGTVSEESAEASFKIFPQPYADAVHYGFVEQLVVVRLFNNEYNLAQCRTQTGDEPEIAAGGNAPCRVARCGVVELHQTCTVTVADMDMGYPEHPAIQTVDELGSFHAVAADFMDEMIVACADGVERPPGRYRQIGVRVPVRGCCCKPVYPTQFGIDVRRGGNAVRLDCCGAAVHMQGEGK